MFKNGYVGKYCFQYNFCNDEEQEMSGKMDKKWISQNRGFKSAKTGLEAHAAVISTGFSMLARISNQFFNSLVRGNRKSCDSGTETLKIVAFRNVSDVLFAFDVFFL